MLASTLTSLEFGKYSTDWESTRKEMVRYLLSQNNTAAPVILLVQKHRISSAMVMIVSYITRAGGGQADKIVSLIRSSRRMIGGLVLPVTAFPQWLSTTLA